jgi:hypothetical protein
MKKILLSFFVLTAILLTSCSDITEPEISSNLDKPGFDKPGIINAANLGSFAAPTNVTASLNGSSVTVSWTAPASVSSISPTEYQVVFEVIEPGSDISSITHSGSTSVTVNNILPGKYSVKVRTEQTRDGNNDFVNSSEFSISAQFQVSGQNNNDNAGPEVSIAYNPLANAYGWNNTSVTATYNASDPSGLSSPASGSYTFTSEGEDQVYDFMVQDIYGNTTVALAKANLDLTKPSVSLNFNGGVWSNGFLIAGSSVNLNTTASDNLSGLLEVTTNGNSGYSSSFYAGSTGTYSFTSIAKDKAENSASRTITFNVAYQFNGWRPPVSLTKSFKSGSTVPVKFIVVDANGNPVKDGLNVIVKIGNSSAAALLDDASTGQYKAEVKLSGTGNQIVSLEGNITQASLSITVR